MTQLKTQTSSTPKLPIARAQDAIAKLAQSFAEVTLEYPWGHQAFKVRGKTFLFLSADAEGLSLSVKLPVSGEAALSLLFTEPTHYGLGKSGWVSANFASDAEVPLELVEMWLQESYVAIAPKKLGAALASRLQGPQGSGALPLGQKPAAQKPVKKSAAKPAAPKRGAAKPAAPKRAAVKPAVTRKSAGKKKAAKR